MFPIPFGDFVPFSLELSWQFMEACDREAFRVFGAPDAEAEVADFDAAFCLAPI